MRILVVADSQNNAIRRIDRAGIQVEMSVRVVYPE